MKSRWSEQGVRDAMDRWSAACGEELALRLYSARLLGGDPNLVLHGGGNVSVKCMHRDIFGAQVECVCVKASGRDLAAIDTDGMPALDLPRLRRLGDLVRLTDEEMVNEIRGCTFDASAPTPSIETLVHAFLPHKFVDHTHADAVLALTNQPNGEKLVREALGDRIAILPYIKPGFDLAREIFKSAPIDAELDAIVLMHHGLITFADGARESYERHIALVDACERFVQGRARKNALTESFKTSTSPSDLCTRVAPILRGALAWPTGDEDRPHARSILEWRATDELLAFVNSKECRLLAEGGPLTCDHLIHTKSKPLLIERPAWHDDHALRAQITAAVDAFRRDYQAYVSTHGGDANAIDPSPRVVLMAGAGLFCWGPTKRQARMAADVAEHTVAAKIKAHSLGGYEFLSPRHLYDMEYRGLQLRKLGAPCDRALAGQVVVITGGAGAIGAAVADSCCEAGANAVLADLDEARLARVVDALRAKHGDGTALGVVMDVTDESSVEAGFERTVREYGGVDVIVPNAGIAHVAPIEQMALSDFRRVMDVNAVGYMLVMREGARLLKKQGLGGHIVINASKNVFGPGKDFGAYSASKAAGHQLGKVAAIELAPFGIRVNMINADAIFGDERNPSGLWAEVGPQRAQSRQMDPADIPEYYRRRNLLKTRIHGRHVGNAVVFFAANFTPTTGATLPVDGGVVEAFPR